MLIFCNSCLLVYKFLVSRILLIRVILNKYLIIIFKPICDIVQIIVVQGFCPLKIKITQFPDGSHLNVCKMMSAEFTEGAFDWEIRI